MKALSVTSDNSVLRIDYIDSSGRENKVFRRASDVLYIRSKTASLAKLQLFRPSQVFWLRFDNAVVAEEIFKKMFSDSVQDFKNPSTAAHLSSQTPADKVVNSVKMSR